MTDSTPARLIVCDDDPVCRSIVKLFVERQLNVEVTFFATGNELLEQAPFPNAGLVLLDMEMPGFSGAETLERLKKIKGCEDLDVVMMSADSSPDFEQRARNNGAAAILRKPLRSSTFVPLVRSLMPA